MDSSSLSIDQDLHGLAGLLLDRYVVDPHSDAFSPHDWDQVLIGKYVPALQRYAAEPLIYLVAYTWLPEQAKSYVASWVNGSAAQSSHYRWAARLQSSNVFEAASVMIALHVFETLVSPAVGRNDVHLLDDLDSLVNGEWVWPRTELVCRMTQSLANVICIETRRPNASPELRFLSTILTSLFNRTQNDTSFLGRFWESRFQGDSCQEAFRQVKEWVASPYRGEADDGPILSDSFLPRVPRRSEVKPILKDDRAYACPVCHITFHSVSAACRHNEYRPCRLLHWTLGIFSTVSRWALGWVRRPHSDKFKFNVVLVGDGGVGKSALIQKAVHGRFVDEYDPTISDSYRKEVSVRGQSCLLDITDLSGQDEIRTGFASDICQADGVIYVYSITDKGTFEAISTLSEEVSGSTDLLGSALIANKLDLAEMRQVSTQWGQEKASRLGALFREVSAKGKDDMGDVLRAFTSMLLRSWEERRKSRMMSAAKSDV